MKIIKEGSFDKTVLTGTCDKCGCKVEFIRAEMEGGMIGMIKKNNKMLGYLGCPHEEHNVDCTGLIFADLDLENEG